MYGFGGGMLSGAVSGAKVFGKDFPFNGTLKHLASSSAYTLGGYLATGDDLSNFDFGFNLYLFLALGVDIANLTSTYWNRGLNHRVKVFAEEALNNKFQENGLAENLQMNIESVNIRGLKTSRFGRVGIDLSINPELEYSFGSFEGTLKHADGSLRFILPVNRISERFNGSAQFLKQIYMSNRYRYKGKKWYE